MKIENKSSNRSFGIVFFIVFFIIAFWTFFENGEIKNWSIIISIIFLLLAVINSKILSPLNNLWFKFGILLGRFVSPIVMAAIFFIVITPISIIIKLTGKDILKLKKNKKKTYWIKRDKSINSMKNQF